MNLSSMGLLEKLKFQIGVLFFAGVGGVKEGQKLRWQMCPRLFYSFIIENY